jgi:membrane peptidoglycan carboxypeptidase
LEPFAQAVSGKSQPGETDVRKAYDAFGFNTAPQLQFETAPPVTATDASDFYISPLQAVLAAAALSNHGVEPAPRIATSVNTPREGWVVLPAQGDPLEAVQPAQADEAAAALMSEGKNYWSHIGRAAGKEGPVTWFVAGTPPDWQATPLAVVVVLEQDNERLVQWIGQELLTDAMNP